MQSIQDFSKAQLSIDYDNATAKQKQNIEQAYASMKQALSFQEIAIDLHSLNASQFAEHFDYSFEKLNSFIKKDNEFKTVAFEALQIANEREEALLYEIAEIEEDIKEKQNKVKSLRSSLFAAKSRVETPRQEVTETPRQAIENALDSSYEDSANSAKSRRNFLIKAFSLAKSRDEKVDFSQLYNLSKTRSKLDFDKFNSNQIAACKTVCKQDLGIKWESVLNIDMIYEEKEYRMT